MNNSSLFFTYLCCLGWVACAKQADNGSNTDSVKTNDSPRDADPTPGGSDSGPPEPYELLEFRELIPRCGDRREEPGARVLDTTGAYQRAFEEAYPHPDFRPDLPEVDFERNVVVEGRWGRGYPNDYYLVTRVREFESRVEVMFTFRTGCWDDDAIHYPCSLTEVPRRDKQYTFVDRVEILPADAGSFCEPDGEYPSRSSAFED